MSSGQRLTLITGVMLSASLKHYSTAVIVDLPYRRVQFRISRFAPLSRTPACYASGWNPIHSRSCTTCRLHDANGERGISPCRVSSTTLDHTCLILCFQPVNPVLRFPRDRL